MYRHVRARRVLPTIQLFSQQFFDCCCTCQRTVMNKWFVSRIIGTSADDTPSSGMALGRSVTGRLSLKFPSRTIISS